MAPRFHYVIDCVSANAPFIHHIVDNNRAEDVGRPRREQEVTYATFRRNCDLSPWKGDINFARDWAVSFHKSVAPSGVPIFYFRWSGIEHVFWPDGEPFNLAQETELAEVAAELDSAAWEEISRHRQAAGTAWHFDGLAGRENYTALWLFPSGYTSVFDTHEDGAVQILDGEVDRDFAVEAALALGYVRVGMSPGYLILEVHRKPNADQLAQIQQWLKEYADWNIDVPDGHSLMSTKLKPGQAMAVLRKLRLVSGHGPAGSDDESESISDYAGFNYAMVSPEGRVYLLAGDTHPDWCDNHRDLFGFVGGYNIDYEPEEGGGYDAEGRIALDYALFNGWIRVKPGGGIQADYVEGRVDLVKRLLRRMAKHHAGRTLYIDAERRANVPVTPTGRPDFSDLDDKFPNG